MIPSHGHIYLESVGNNVFKLIVKGLDTKNSASWSEVIFGLDELEELEEDIRKARRAEWVLKR